MGKPRPDLVGKKHSAETVEKQRRAVTGLKRSEETRRKISVARSGPGNNHWRGGITPLNKAIRNHLAGWARRVKARDGKCVLCGAVEFLEADHIEPVALRPDLMFDMNNGRALCHQCHIKTLTYGGRNLYKSLPMR